MPGGLVLTLSLIIIFISGTVFGSFYNCLAMRLIRHEDFIKKRSHCMSCGHSLSALDLIPVIGYISSKGRCRYCKEKVSIRYPLTELLFALLTTGLFIKEVVLPLHFGGWYEINHYLILFLRDFILIGMLFTLSITDIETYIIPDGLLITAFIAWVGSAYFLYDSIKDFLFSILAAFLAGAFLLILSAVLERILKKDALGGGDVKLIALLSLYFSFFGTYELLLFSSFIGIGVAAISKKRMIPFGPSISAGAYLVLIFGDYLKDFYLSFF